MKRTLFSLILIALAFQVWSQQVIFKPAANINVKANNILSELLKDIKPLASFSEYYTANFNGQISKQEALRSLRASTSIDYIMTSPKTEMRYVPNDERFPDQWNLNITSIDQAWDVTNDGRTVDNREIVIAIADSGFALDIEDFQEVLWRNEQEIPNDGIDNDNNGYIDDYLGWNVSTLDDQHFVDSHGTSVAAIIGARGDNSIGISGINKQIKLMLISFTDGGPLAEIPAAYDYILKQRQLYNQTNGQQGAFIVASNLSAGANGFEMDVPWFCEPYEALGNEGILSVGATANSAVDVDIEGDLPSTCTSPYLIVTTSTTIDDNLRQNRAFGKVHVDIGAPEGVISYRSTGAYEEAFSGTSCATPHVTGVIGLLYSIECQALIDLNIDNPTEAVTTVRDAILNGTDPLLDLAQVTSSGGRLNAFKAIEELSSVCGSGTGGIGPLEIVTIQQNRSQNSVDVFFNTETFEAHDLEIFDYAGRRIFEKKFTPALFTDKRISFSYSGYESGAYIIRLTNSSESSTYPLLILD